MNRFQDSIADKRKELQVAEERLVEWQSEGFVAGVGIVKKRN